MVCEHSLHHLHPAFTWPEAAVKVGGVACLLAPQGCSQWQIDVIYSKADSVHKENLALQSISFQRQKKKMTLDFPSHLICKESPVLSCSGNKKQNSLNKYILKEDDLMA